MDELVTRQMALLDQLIIDYREGVLGLSALIQRIEGIGDVLGNDAWKEAIFPIVLSMEEVNAVALDARRALTENDKTTIENSLLELEVLINRFKGPI